MLVDLNPMIAAGLIDCPKYAITRQPDGQWHGFIKEWNADMGLHATWQGAYVAIKDYYGDDWWI